MLAIEGGLNRFPERHLARPLHQHGGPGNRLQHDPVQAQREAEQEHCYHLDRTLHLVSGKLSTTLEERQYWPEW